MTASPYFRLAQSAAAFGVAALLSLGASAQIASGTTGIDASGDARSEMNACLTGRTQQDRETCMTEVRNANAAKRAGKVDNANGDFKANALRRCDIFQGEDLVACQARIVGYGKTEGSVAGGGAIRQIETVVVPAGATNVRVQPQTSSDNFGLNPAPVAAPSK
jgi:hypothetical protein